MNYATTPPDNFKDAQSLTVDYFRKRIDNPDFSSFGIEGQAQYGIDSFGWDNNRGGYCVAQVKAYTTKKSTKTIISDLNKELNLFDELFNKKSPDIYNKTKFYYFVAFCNETQDAKFLLKIYQILDLKRIYLL